MTTVLGLGVQYGNKVQAAFDPLEEALYATK
jgi:hypothetical protein